MLPLSEPTNIVENGCDVGMKSMSSHACPIIHKATFMKVMNISS